MPRVQECGWRSFPRALDTSRKQVNLLELAATSLLDPNGYGFHEPSHAPRGALDHGYFCCADPAVRT